MTEIISIIREGLVLLNKLVPDQATRLDKEMQDYETQWNAEYSKGPNRDDNMLDQLDIKLQYIKQLYSDAVTAAASKN